MEHYIDDIPRNPFPDGFRPGEYRSPARRTPVKSTPRRPFRERLLRNCTIGGVLLAAALSVLILDTPVTNDARAWLRSAFSAETTAGKVIDTLWDTVQTALGREEAPEMQVPAAPLSGYDRIDEDILDALQNENDAYNAKNRHAPSAE